MLILDYIDDFNICKRRKTVTATIGAVKIGSDFPVCLQSMANTSTRNTIDSVEQAIRIYNAGGELVRFTAQGVKEARNLAEIKKELRLRGFTFPLVADIHFNPNAALEAAGIVEKVRINPGNFVDKKKFQSLTYTDEEYNEELNKVSEKLIPLIDKCKTNSTAIRIGVNHGSLSDRIMSRYGDTAEGMVESCLEFLRIFRAEDFHNIIISMKASNTRMVVYATRLLVKNMKEEDMHYPLHLGVTEAGEGEDGRIKSAIGIGASLADGIGDTIRVSLTEDPEDEIPVAQKLAEYCTSFSGKKIQPEFHGDFQVNPYDYAKREIISVGKFDNQQAKVIFPVEASEINDQLLEELNFKKNKEIFESTDTSPDFIMIKNGIPDDFKNRNLNLICDSEFWDGDAEVFPCFSLEVYASQKKRHPDLNFLRIKATEISDDVIQTLEKESNAVLIFEPDLANPVFSARNFVFILMQKKIELPVVISGNYSLDNIESLQVKSSVDMSLPLLDGLIDGISIQNNSGKNTNKEVNTLMFGILQSARVRITKTEFISCPSCGRTLFDLQETTKSIRTRLSHLKGLKIAIMGCIVNGPGEMADADYGYVGAGPGKVTLYKGKEIVKSNVLSANAVDELINIIKENGDYADRIET